MVDRHYQESNLNIILDNNGFKFTDAFFPYTSGEIGPYFVNSEVVVKSPNAYHHSIQSLKHLVNSEIGLENFDIFSGGESRDWIFSNPLAIELKKPLRMFYKDGRKFGGDVKGKRVLHVSDLNNEGSSPRDLWVPSIRKDGGTIEHYLSYVDRMEKGVGVLRNLGIQPHSVVPLDEVAWNLLLKSNIFNEEMHRNIRERMENQDAWGIKMLKSKLGSKRLKELLEDPKSADKVNKILDYYILLDEGILDVLVSNGVKL